MTATKGVLQGGGTGKGKHYKPPPGYREQWEEMRRTCEPFAFSGTKYYNVQMTCKCTVAAGSNGDVEEHRQKPTVGYAISSSVECASSGITRITRSSAAVPVDQVSKLRALHQSHMNNRKSLTQPATTMRLDGVAEEPSPGIGENHPCEF